MTGGAREEIAAGIQPGSGALLLTQSVQDSAFGGQKYECQCGTGTSECHIIYGELQEPLTPCVVVSSATHPVSTIVGL